MAQPLAPPPAQSGGDAVDYVCIQHSSLVVTDKDASKHFYLDVLGMQDDTHLRSDAITFPGAFVRAGASQIHLMQVHNLDPTSRPVHPAE